MESAEKIKLFLSQQAHRRVLRPEDDEEKREKPSDEIDLSSLNLPEEVRKVSYKTLVDGIIRPRMNEIFTMVGIEIKKSGYGGQTPAGLVITGGGAMTVGIKDAAKRMLAMPVRVGTPIDLKGIVDEVQNPAYASVVGLLMYGAKNDVSKRATGFGFSMPKVPGGSNHMMKKIIELIKSFIP